MTLTIDHIELHVKKLFDLEEKMRDKDLKITLLEFEVAIQKNLIEAFKRHSSVNLLGET